MDNIMLVLLVWALYRVYQHFYAQNKAESLIPVIFEILKLDSNRQHAVIPIQQYLKDFQDIVVSSLFVSDVLSRYYYSEDYQSKRQEMVDRENQDLLEMKLEVKLSILVLEQHKKVYEEQLRSEETPQKILFLPWRSVNSLTSFFAA